jgi:hypothetical protein
MKVVYRNVQRLETTTNVALDTNAATQPDAPHGLKTIYPRRISTAAPATKPFHTNGTKVQPKGSRA